MKKNNFLLSIASVALLSGCLASCGKSTPTITVWVGEESAQFYQKMCNQYKVEHANFGYDVVIKGIDTGTVAGTITSDPKAAGDIFTVAHDNIGKLAGGKYAKPMVDQLLIDQVESDNPDSFKSVIYSTLEGKRYLFGAPYISQALFLYYNAEKISAEQAKSFEGIFAAAKDAGNKVKGVTVVGDDGFNFSFTLLAQNATDHSTSVKIYEGATESSKGTSNVQGDDMVSRTKWLQEAYNNPNGFAFASQSGWEQDLNNNAVLSVIGGAWHYEAAAAAIGSSKIGITILPTFTITEDQAVGTCQAGTTFRAGTFADCKVFMINAYSDSGKYAAEQELIRFLTSKDIQTRSFVECSNVPAYEGASSQFKTLYEDNRITLNQYLLASAQVDMASWGIPQPFITGTLNTYFYSKSAPAVYRALIEGKNYPETDPLVTNTYTTNGVRQGLYLMEYIWMHGKNPTSIPTELPVAA